MSGQVTPPSGTVTFLFTDVVNSTVLWETHPRDMAVAMRTHDEVLRAAVADHGGFVFTTAGDSFAAAFARAGAGVACAVDIQRRLRAVQWPSATPISARVGLHTGEADERDDDYFGAAVGRAARVMSAGHGGQILATSATAALAGGWLDHDVAFAARGEHRFTGLAARLEIVQVNAVGLVQDFPALRSLEVPNNMPRTDGRLIGRSASSRLGASPTGCGGVIWRRSVPTSRFPAWSPQCWGRVSSPVAPRSRASSTSSPDAKHCWFSTTANT